MLRIKLLKGIPVQPTVLAAVHSKSGLATEQLEPMPLATVVENLQQAKALAKIRRSQHKELRQSYLENLAWSIAEHKHPFLALEEDSEALRSKAARELQNLIKWDQRRRSFWACFGNQIHSHRAS